MIASRKVERLQKAAETFRKQIPALSGAEINYVKCNIREEDEVILNYKDH